MANPQEVQVYIALKDVFKDFKHMPVGREIRSVIAFCDRPEVHELLQKQPLDAICQRATKLLSFGVFASENNAKAWFRGAFEARSTNAPSPNTDHSVVTKTPIQKPCTEATKQAETQGTMETGGLDGNVEERTNVTVPEAAAATEQTGTVANTGTTVPSLFPVYLHFPAQHQMASAIQALLEKTCFIFAQNHIGHILKENGWSHPEQVPLAKWSSIMLKHDTIIQSKIGLERLNSLECITIHLITIARIAEQRTALKVDDLDMMFKLAKLITKTFEDDESYSTVERLMNQTLKVCKGLRDRKQESEKKLGEKLKEIDAQRTELKRQEERAIEVLLEEDKWHQFRAAKKIERALSKPKSATVLTPSQDSEDYEAYGEDSDDSLSVASLEMPESGEIPEMV